MIYPKTNVDLDTHDYGYLDNVSLSFLPADAFAIDYVLTDLTHPWLVNSYL